MSSRIIPFVHERATAKLVMWDRKNATVCNVFSINRGSGHATALMEKIVSYADEKGIDLVLEAKPFGYSDNISPSASGLRKWYSKFGFKHVGEGMMQRPSQKIHAP